VLADLQTARVTGYERDAVARLMALKPDIILLPGDVFQGTREEFQEERGALRELLAQLSAPGGVYLVLGDVDGGGERLREILRSTRVRLLDDEVVRIDVGDRRVTIAGVGLDATTARAREAVDRLESGTGEDDIRILVAHRPDVALGLRPMSRIDLVVAGHTHGGQVVLPWFGPPMTLSRVPRAVAAGGLHSLGGNAIYVSRGVGYERGQAPRIRFLCPPEISLLELGADAAG
jgi:predicted MPP superfamily phosphohydrolase